MGSSNIIELPLEFKKYGHIYRQVKRYKNICLYSISYTKPSNCSTIGYDVYLIETTHKQKNSQESKEKGLPDDSTKLIERIPGSEKWGKKGWSFQTLPVAMAKYKELGGIE